MTGSSFEELENKINAEIRRLVQEHLSQIEAAAKRVLGIHHALAMDDLCQEVAIAVWRALEKGTPIKEWKGFIYHCAHVRALDWLKQTRRWTQRKVSLTDLKDGGDAESQESLTGAAMALDRLDQVLDVLNEELAKLPERIRLTVLLRLGEGYSRAEVAQMLHCSEATVDYRLRRGRQELRKRLGQYGWQNSILTDNAKRLRA